MSANRVTIQGTINPDGILVLDELSRLPPGRVEVTLQTVSDPVPTSSGWWEVLRQISQERAARSEEGRTREEIDADCAALRAEDDEYEERWRQIHARTVDPLPPESKL